MPYDRCCGRLHRQEGWAATAEDLMRSRYSAFVVGDAAHLMRTWHPTTRPAHLVLDPSIEWLRLEVVATTGGGMLDDQGTVDFRAWSRGGLQTELSEFVRVDGRWVYLRAMDAPVRST